MHQLEIHGSTKRIRTKVKHLSEWLLYRLLRERTAQQIFLEIRLERHLVVREGIWGSIEMPWSEAGKRPRDFLIRLASDQGEFDIMTTLCHEAVHLRQYATGQMVEQVRSGAIRYRKKTYAPTIAYSKMPWETEAQDLQYKLYDEYNSHLADKSS